MEAEPTEVIKHRQVQTDILERILGGFWNNALVRVTNVELEVTPRGSNFISSAWRVRFDHTKSEDPEDEDNEFSKTRAHYTQARRDAVKGSVFVKSVPEDEVHNRRMSTVTHFRNEILAYERILTVLGTFTSGSLRLPAYIYGNRANIVLEDMVNRSFTSMNRRFINTWEKVWSPIQEMAKLHASSIVMNKVKKTEFKEMLKEITEIPLDKTTALASMQATTINTTVEILRIENHPQAEKFSKTLLELKDIAWKRQKEIIEKEVPVMVVNHGNFWINNILYHNNIAMLIDWQHVVYSTPATDLAFLFYVNFGIGFLKNQRKTILEYYLTNLHQSIYDCCDQMEMSIPEIDELLKPLTYDWIDSELKRCSLCGYMMAQWINPIFFWSDGVFEMMETLGGMESMSIEKRLETMTTEQKDRVIQLTEIFMNECEDIEK